MKTAAALKNIMLSKITLLLEELEIHYWLESGTLLGLFRENDHLESHDNVDIGIPGSSVNQILLKKN